ncbi:MAG TPA: SH3 domain-containing protein [Clostridium sp.]
MKNVFKTLALTTLFYILISGSSQTFAKDLSKSSLKSTSYGLGIATRQYINLRSTPDMNNNTNKIAVLMESDRFFIVDDLGEWYKVKYNDNGTLRDGYVYALFTMPIRDDSSDSYLGFISSKYESTVYTENKLTSVRNPGTVSNNAGDAGGKSYGLYQLSSNRGTLDVFLNYLKTHSDGNQFYDKLNNAKIADGNKYNRSFDTTWKQLATNNTSKFFELQHKFVKTKYYDVAASMLKDKYNFDISTKSLALKEALWSTAVQYGIKGNGTTTKGAIDIFAEAGLNNGEKELITRIYDIKIEHAESKNNDGLKNRALSEKNDVLNMYNSYNEIAK